MIDSIVDGVREVVRLGNANRVVVKNGQGDKVVEVPVTAGVVVGAIAPVATVAGVLVALAGGWTIDVEQPGSE
ncbi:DUF4342 domain-containing protein [Actinosynnema sp. NPDC020468]|uniref:DUF4342 domain-containing protein n=1 Tax=Actinosynnema sp. NPDC020468 TaxID=3154488 RepID=UPI0033D2C6CF